MEGLDLAYISQGLILFIILVCSLCLRECARAWAAAKLGDDTPVHHGRLTLNPIPHIDLLGTIILPLFCIFFLHGRFFLGWAKPLPLDPGNLKKPSRDEMLLALAGPAGTFLITLIAAVIGGGLARLNPGLGDLFSKVIVVNAWLFTFNMLPIPPFDGGHVLRYFTGMSRETFASISIWGSFAVLGCFYLVPGFPQFFQLLIGIVATPAFVIQGLVAGGGTPG